MPVEEEYKAGHLILLVGTNPLPNAVAGALLTSPGGTITLVYSKGVNEINTALKSWLEAKGKDLNWTVEPCLVDESDPFSVHRQVKKQLGKVAASRVGLHYTGGTKVMAVHAYHAVEQWADKLRGNGRPVETVFSYLNARTLRMQIDPLAGSNEYGPSRYVALDVEMTLEDLLVLHDWELEHGPVYEPILPLTAKALAEACSGDGFDAWESWIGRELTPRCRREGGKWKSKTELKNVALSLPEDESLSKVVRALREELSLESENCGLVHNSFNSEPKPFCQWLHGKWLEHHLLAALNTQAQFLRIQQCAQNIVPGHVQFDVDVVALRGYQLFAFSCGTDTDAKQGGKARLKEKLFEAYIRARQLGGDEARVALVCCADNPGQIQREMTRDIDLEGRIRVFGRDDLKDLPTHIGDWIRSQTGKED